MLLIVGLGNPGEQYEHTRHNVGREIVQYFQKKQDFPEFRFEKKWNAEITEGTIDNTKAILILPDTMMNKSGSAVGAISRFFKIKPEHTLIIHDDADIALGMTKLSFGKRSAGHRGVESIKRTLKTTDYWRFRIGIAGKKDIPAQRIVLKKFSPQEKRVITRVTKKTISALEQTVREGPEKARNEYNK